jgi:hypothetical protein
LSSKSVSSSEEILEETAIFAGCSKNYYGSDLPFCQVRTFSLKGRGIL